MTPLTYILSRQIEWARRNGKPLKHHYCSSLKDNLFEELSAETTAEFNRADGNELRSSNGRPAKMLALRSSSALAVNAFHYWRHRDLSVIAKAGRIPSRGIASLEFEKISPICAHVDRDTYPKDPNIDVVVTYERSDLREVAIESKFAEAYERHRGLKQAYLQDSALWRDLPPPPPQPLAASCGVFF